MSLNNDQGSPNRPPQYVSLTSSPHKGRSLALTAMVCLLVWASGLSLVGCATEGNATPPTGKPAPSDPVESFQAVEKAQKPLVRFIAFGDCGAGTPWQFQLAKTMETLHKAAPYRAALIVGDIIYEDGDYEKYGVSRYIKPYKPLWDAGVIFLPALGNHDVLRPARVDGLIDFLKMPDRYYTSTLGEVTFFALDTNRFNDTQAQWLDSALAQSKSRWNIVYGHHPLYTSGAHGVSDPLLKKLRPRLEEILTKHHVPLYVAGHDHDYERFNAKNGIVQIVTGGGGAYLRDFKTPLPHSAKRLKLHHFVFFEVFGNRIDMTTFGLEGQILDRASIPQPPPQS